MPVKLKCQLYPKPHQVCYSGCSLDARARIRARVARGGTEGAEGAEGAGGAGGRGVVVIMSYETLKRDLPLLGAARCRSAPPAAPPGPLRLVKRD